MQGERHCTQSEHNGVCSGVYSVRRVNSGVCRVNSGVCRVNTDARRVYAGCTQG